MSTSSNTSFFSFGPDDSFVSKSFEGLRYRNLPPALLKLIVGGSVVDVHWAALGPVQESWVLSFKDANGKNNLGWGSSIPPTLAQILKTLTPTQHLRVFLGPKHSKTSKNNNNEPSFIAWDPTFIRWSGLPPPLEACLQSWLTPAGWKFGPPRTMTWNAKGAFFAKSEYDEVMYEMGSREGLEDDDWPPFQDTVREWNEEADFEWSDVVYLNLDARDSDQFIAIRTDGTWAGSIGSDSNEEALEAFALNFFTRLKPKISSSNSKTRPQSQSIPKPPPQSQQNYNNYQNSNNNSLPTPNPPNVNTVPDATSQALYERWATETATMLALALAANNTPTPTSTPTPTARSKPKTPKKLQVRSASKPNIPTSANGAPPALLTTFPYLPAPLATCPDTPCVYFKSDPAGLRACKHDVERLLRASGLYSYEWLRQERIRWHPDRFGRLCDEGFRERGCRLAEEMFKIVDGLVGEAEGRR
ncbi:hypothetical protein K505DRAFT_317612 [Melanomma pulvis-pyrius CBS 109.77]|uniref:Uncharacterized protein n=1 Tax=Melanomma pulvis-pyrius CBS 109.77 TaxID=1314802 RepID=A0A6A6WSK6_9PLEO|nr:hypothetical protein K505DRAFT_317612 [Melanomma pulvis-pyrius CBS 109.77]